MKNAVRTSWQRIKSLLLPLLLLFWLFCLPLAFSIYTPYLYQANCYWNERCEQLGPQQAENRTAELNRFFLHRNNELPAPWTQKENLHMSEVRLMYDYTFTVFAFITLLFLLDMWRGRHSGRNKQRYRRYVRNSLLISGALVVLVLLMSPFFPTIWMRVFHPLLFDNDLWRTNSSDVSWYLMPKAFFLRVIIFICLVTLLLNLLAASLLAPGRGGGSRFR